MNKCNMKLKHSTIYAGNQKIEKYLDITKHVQDLYVENYKILMNEIKEEVGEWIYIPCS